MSYFNHAFQKVFVATGSDITGTPANTTADLVATNGDFGIFNPKTYQVIDSTGSPASGGESFIIAASSIYDADKVGPYHGGYTESNKSKLINPRYISKFWKVNDKNSIQALTIIGKTDDASTDACECPVFECGRTYRLRVDIKGSPALRFLNHQLYDTFDAYTGCCANPAEPNNVDPVTVMIEWAKQILEHPFLSQFVKPVVIYTEDITAGSPTWVSLGESPDPAVALAELEAYVPETGSVADYCVGIELTGAYVDTVFGDCSFKPTDHFEKEPVQIYASFVNDLDDPCQHNSLCVTQTRFGEQGEGYGETIIRELMLSESYSQNYFNCNPRIREITQSDNFFDAITRSNKYDVYYLQHNVPRFNNPTGTFDNDQYLLKIVVPQNATTFDDIETWILANCAAAGNSITLETFNP